MTEGKRRGVDILCSMIIGAAIMLWLIMLMAALHEPIITITDENWTCKAYETHPTGAVANCVNWERKEK